MSADLVRVGVRELRDDLARYLNEGQPVAITRHGQTVGFLLPVQGSIAVQDLAALREAADKLRLLLTERGINEDEIVDEFRSRRSRSQTPRS